MFTGKDIKTKRLSLGLSAEKLAKKIGVKTGNLYKWEKGHIPHDPEDYNKIKSWLNGESVKPKAEIVKEDPIASDFKEKYYSLLEKYNSLLESIVKK